MKVIIPLEDDSLTKAGNGPGRIIIERHGPSLKIVIISAGSDDRYLTVSAGWLERSLVFLASCLKD